MKIAFLNVGQGDTTIISSPETKEAIVVDCVDALKTLDYLQQENIKHIRAIIVTHLHSDHYHGVRQLLSDFDRNSNIKGIDKLFVNPLLASANFSGQMQDSDRHSKSYNLKQPAGYRRLRTTTKERGMSFSRLETNGNVVRLPLEGSLGGAIEVIHPDQEDFYELVNLNNASIVLRVIGGKGSVLLTGDIEPAAWNSIRSRHPEHLKNDFLKFPHHGAWIYDEVEISDFIDDVSPSHVVISVGSSNTYNHPSPNVFQELYARPDIRLLCTQATPQCTTNLSAIKDSLLQKHNHQNDMQSSGCPCAGDVVVEITDKSISVLKPSLQFHIEQIIDTLDKPQCNLNKHRKNMTKQPNVRSKSSKSKKDDYAQA